MGDNKHGQQTEKHAADSTDTMTANGSVKNDRIEGSENL